MAIIDSTTWSAWANIPLVGGELASVDMICLQVDKSIKTRLKRVVEETEMEGIIMDAPPSPVILLGRWEPIQIETLEVYLNYQANGNPDGFSSSDLLTLYTDYTVDKSKEDPTLSTGKLTKIGGVWGGARRAIPNLMSTQLVTSIGALKINLTGGYPPGQIPYDIIEAACITVSKVLGVRRYGMQVGSESWNGYSYNLPGVGMMVNGLIGNPDITGLLEPYVNYPDIIG